MSRQLQLNRISCVLPDGRALFSRLDHTFSLYRTGLIGSNGVGKTLLGKILTGQIQPSDGTVTRQGRMHFLAQEPDPESYPTVAALAGVAPILTALERIAAGSIDETDHALVTDRWDCAARLQTVLERQGLAHLTADTATTRLSGGERQRVALLGAWLSDADWLVLDEPSNHLDVTQRQWLIDCMRRWTKGLVLISHDRDLLEHVDDTLELSPRGLTLYGGNYSHYFTRREQEQTAAQAGLQSVRADVRRERNALRMQAQNHQKHSAWADSKARTANQSKPLLDARKERHQNSGGKLKLRQQAAREQSSQRLAEAMARCEPEQEMLLLSPDSVVPAGRTILRMRNVRMPFGQTGPVNLTLTGPARLAVSGDNGSGKSTLLHIIAGRVKACDGEVFRYGRIAWLAQHDRSYCSGFNAIRQLQRTNPSLSESDIRTRLALLGLDAVRAQLDSALLSGGERIKLALAAELYAAVPPQLLLLDEPDNHLDLPSLTALENMLNQYCGALIVVSHDHAFLRNIRLDDEIRLTME